MKFHGVTAPAWVRADGLTRALRDLAPRQTSDRDTALLLTAADWIARESPPADDLGTSVRDVIASILDGHGWAFLKVTGLDGVQIDSTDIAQAIVDEFGAVLNVGHRTAPPTDRSSDIIRGLMREVASSPVSYSPDNPGAIVAILDINVWNAISAISSMSPPAESEDG
jgi:hypothetical protein